MISFLKTFFSVFIILMFIFVLQTIWLYISELAGKDLDVWVVLKFLWYVSPRLIPLVLPLTILVASLMVFGNLSEKYEFAAMKSTGISLQRAMRSLTIFILLLAVTAFFFANNVIPYSEYKWQNLRRNIAQVSPSMVIAEGQFSQIGDDYSIKVAEKSGDRDQYLKDIIIHKKTPSRPNGNYTVMIADNGELASSLNSNTLSLILNDGYYYEEIQSKDPKKQRTEPFVKSYFEQFTINIDLTEFNNTDVDKENELSNHNMYKMSELFVEIDSLSVSYTEDVSTFADNMYYRSGISNFSDEKVRQVEGSDTLDKIIDAYQPQLQINIVNMALNNVRGTIQSTRSKKIEFQIKTKRLNKHEIALHEKYVLAFACIILFFVGAPLGAIIRKGGMGLPMVVAILLFLTYHFIGIFAKNSAEDGTMHPFIASWLSTAIMLPLGVWLTYRATTDQGIFDIDSFLQRFRKSPASEAEIIYENLNQDISISAEEKAQLEKLSIDQLKDSVKNHKQYGYSHDYRIAALRCLDAQGISQEHMHVAGDLFNKKYQMAEKLVKKFKKLSTYTFIFYALVIILPIIVAVALVNTKDETATVIVSGVSLISLILFYVLLFRTQNTVTQLSKLTKDETVFAAAWLIGMPFYIFLYFYYRKHIQRSMKNVF
nr:LptF/LptG family permease [Aureitalea sp. L0-47]